ncbi:unnamed protein product, partial [Durusdinium trenchii]
MTMMTMMKKKTSKMKEKKGSKEKEERIGTKAPSESSSSSADGFGCRSALESPESDREETAGPARPAQTPSRRRMSADESMELLQKKMEENAAKRREADKKKQKAKFRRNVANFMDGPWMTLISVSLT